MNLATKIYKFKKAVWEYRGKYDPKTGKWYKLPSTKAKARVVKGLQRLGIDPKDGMLAIDAMPDKPTFDAFIRTIAENKKGK